MIPIATLRNIKRGRSLYWEENGTMNTSTMITIGVLSSLIVLSLIVTIIVISHRKVQILILTIWSWFSTRPPQQQIRERFPAHRQINWFTKLSVKTSVRWVFWSKLFDCFDENEKPADLKGWMVLCPANFKLNQIAAFCVCVFMFWGIVWGHFQRTMVGYWHNGPSGAMTKSRLSRWCCCGANCNVFLTCTVKAGCPHVATDSYLGCQQMHTAPRPHFLSTTINLIKCIAPACSFQCFWILPRCLSLSHNPIDQ